MTYSPSGVIGGRGFFLLHSESALAHSRSSIRIYWVESAVILNLTEVGVDCNFSFIRKLRVVNGLRDVVLESGTISGQHGWLRLLNHES